MTLTKESIVESVFSTSDLKKVEAVHAIESLIEIIKRTLASGEDVLISGFGKFCVKDKGERRGRNPYTGDAMMLAQRRIVVFKCSGKLRDKINGDKKKGKREKQKSRK
jgi:integration host factor subunit alpha